MARKVGIIVQARMGSSRLPGKVMMDVAGRPMLETLLHRLKSCRMADEVIVATTVDGRDDIIAGCAARCGAFVFRGDEDDVLSRYYCAASERGLDVIVRVTSDCPLSDPVLIDSMIRAFLSQDSAEYLSNTIERTFPRGYDAEVFSMPALKKAFDNARRSHEREHVTVYIYDNLPVTAYVSDDDASSFRVTVDTEEDLAAVRKIFEALSGKGGSGYAEVVALLRSRPDLVAINSHVEQKAVRRN